jgi:hypothetical protein
MYLVSVVTVHAEQNFVEGGQDLVDEGELDVLSAMRRVVQTGSYDEV